MSKVAPAIKERAAWNLGVCEACNFKHSTSAGLYVTCNNKPGAWLPAWKTEICPMGYWAEAGEEVTVKRLKYLHDGRLVKMHSDHERAFLLCCGPSMVPERHKQLLPLLRPNGLVTMGINNCPIATDYWVCVDDPTPFPNAFIFPYTINFVPVRRLGEVPPRAAKVYGYNEHTNFKWWRFLAEERVSWGNQTMMIAVRLLFDLGIRELFIVGADFHMEEGTAAYCDGRSATAKHAHGNNHAYLQLNDRFCLLRPLLEKHGMRIWNCTPDSRLTAFETLDYNEAIERCSDGLETSSVHG